MVRITGKDLQLLSLLRKDGRMSWTDVASHMGVSRVAVQNRARRLQQKGIILGYSVVIASGAETHEHSLHFFRIKLKRGATTDMLIEAVRERWTDVSCWPVSGQWNAVVQVIGQDITQVEAMALEIGQMNSVSAVELDSPFA